MLMDSAESLKRTEITGSLSLTTSVEPDLRQKNPGETRSLLVQNIPMIGSSGR